MSTRILALDLARVTGWAVVVREPGRPPVVAASGAVTVGTGRWAADWDRAHRDAWSAEQLACWVQRIVELERITTLVLEDAFADAARTRAARQLWILRGAALAGARLARPRISVVDAPIRTWQVWAAAEIGWRKQRGRAGDEADARAIGLWAASGNRCVDKT